MILNECLKLILAIDDYIEQLRRRHIARNEPPHTSPRMSSLPNAAPEEAGLLHANLERVFGERDSARRLTAIQALYAEDATLFEPHAVATGHAAINHAVEALLSSLPPTFAFAAIGPAVAHHGVGRLRWASGPAGGPAVATGTDVARFAEGRIQTLHVFLDPASA